MQSKGLILKKRRRNFKFTMAMLAEKRSKVKWTLNPRGKLWMNDEKKFGQKLMERMGWTKGKGLGKDQQGGLDPIRVMYKQDSKGLGFKWSNDDWIAHKDDFNAILANLNVVCDEKPANPAITPASLEEKSKSTKSRVHYHKFTRGKDMSRYSQEDLKCILGEREKKKEEEIEIKEKKMEYKELEEVGEESNSHGVTTIKGGNINEYFQSKLAKLKVNISSQPRNGEVSDRPGFGLGYKPDEDEVSSKQNRFVGVTEQPQGYGFEPSLEQRSKPNIFVNLLSEFETETTKKRKRRIEEIDNETNEILEKSKKMKKDEMEKPCVRFNDEVEVRFISGSSIGKNSGEVHAEVHFSEYGPEKKKKKKSKERNEDLNMITKMVEESVSKNENKSKENRDDASDIEVYKNPETVQEKKIKKKKKSKKNDTEKEEFKIEQDVASREVDIVLKKEKKSKEKDKLLVADDSNEVASLNSNMDDVKKIKRKKKKNAEKEETLETDFDAIEQAIAMENKVKMKKDKTKECKMKVAEMNREESNYNVEYSEIKKKKKKNKEKKEAVDTNDNGSDQFILMEQEVEIEKNKAKEAEVMKVSEEDSKCSLSNGKPKTKERKEHSVSVIEVEKMISEAKKKQKKTSEKKKKHADLEVATMEQPEIVMATAVKQPEAVVPKFSCIPEGFKESTLKSMQFSYSSASFSSFRGANLHDIIGYGS